jgi:nitronate monooxygenase
MLTVSGPELVVAACRSGVVGAFPTAHCRSAAELDEWLHRIGTELGEPSAGAAPFCPNLIVHRTNRRLDDDLAALCRHGVEVVITSVGSPAPVVDALHARGARVWSDVATLRHADRAAALGVDGLVLLCAGAGGQTGHANPFAFARAVRARFAGTVILAGGLADGASVHAARVLGCDLAYVGTRFIATAESRAPARYKEMLVSSELDDVVLTDAFTGLPANMLGPSIAAAGLDPHDLPPRVEFEMSRTLVTGDARPPSRWRDVWSAGHSVSAVRAVVSVEELVDELAAGYEGSRAGRLASP